MSGWRDLSPASQATTAQVEGISATISRCHDSPDGPAEPETSSPNMKQEGGGEMLHHTDQEPVRQSDHLEHDTHAEIQELIDQFADQELTANEWNSSRPPAHISIATSLPERKSSLQPLHTATLSGFQQDKAPGSLGSRQDQAPFHKSLVRRPERGQEYQPRPGDDCNPSSPRSPATSMPLQEPLPPSDPEPDLPFDFHRFLEQLRHRTADPVAKFLRSFLTEFGKKQWMVHEQVKIIGDFLAFITGKMAQCEVWRDASDAEFDNAREGMEKLVMNRLYVQTFSPAISPTKVTLPNKVSKVQTRHASTGRRGQHQEDVERDAVLAQKICIYRWIRGCHLDIPPVDEQGERFLGLARQELLKIGSYRAPRDKVICVLNCCKVLFGLLRSSKQSDTSADAFIPLLIFTVLKANPEHLVSNIQYILRFRNQEKLGDEAGYYVSSLMGAIQFIENMDRTVLNIRDEDFEREVEAAVSAMAERDPAASNSVGQHGTPEDSEKPAHAAADWEKKSKSPVENNARLDSSASEVTLRPEDEGTATRGILGSIQRPLSSIGRIFSEGDGLPPRVPSTSGSGQQAASAVTPGQKSTTWLHQTKMSPEFESGTGRGQEASEAAGGEQARLHQAPAPQVISPAGRSGHQDVVNTLTSMFPTLDKDVIVDVVRIKNGSVSSAVDALLAMNA